MIVIDGVELYEERDLPKLVADKVMFKPRLKDVDGRMYTIQEYFPHHILMKDCEFGTRRCFKYSEVFWRMN